jgi:hypothetical protein
MKPLFLILVLVLLAPLPAGAAQEVATVVVPVVGSVFGDTMIRWRTDVEIINDTGAPADVALELSSAPGAPVILLTLGPGEVQHFTDIIGEAFGLDLMMSPLRVMTGGRRPVTVRATAYAVRGSEVSPLQPLAAYPPQSYYPLRVLDGLAFSDEFRTNIGLVNLGEHDVDFILALQRVPGRNLAIARYRVAAGAMAHTSIQTIFPLITKGTGFSVVVETGAPETYVYASVIESPTHAGKFIVSRIGTR